MQFRNGKIYIEGPEGDEVEAPISPTGAYFWDGYGWEKVPKAPVPTMGQEITGGIARGYEGIKGSAFELLPAMLASAFGAEKVTDNLLASYKSRMEKVLQDNPTAAKDFAEIGSVEDFARWTAANVGEQLPNLAAVAIPGLGGASLAARGLLGAAKVGTGAALGAGVGSAALNVPESFQTIFEETGQKRPGLALATGLAKSGLDVASLAVPYISVMGGRATSALFDRLGSWASSRAGRAALGTAAAGIAEGGTEATQEVLDRAAVKFIDENKDLFPPSVLEAGAVGTMIGTLLGGIVQVSIRNRPTKKEFEAGKTQEEKDFLQESLAGEGVAGERFETQRQEKEKRDLAWNTIYRETGDIPTEEKIQEFLARDLQEELVNPPPEESYTETKAAAEKAKQKTRDEAWVAAEKEKKDADEIQDAGLAERTDAALEIENRVGRPATEEEINDFLSPVHRETPQPQIGVVGKERAEVVVPPFPASDTSEPTITKAERSHLEEYIASLEPSGKPLSVLQIQNQFDRVLSPREARQLLDQYVEGSKTYPLINVPSRFQLTKKGDLFYKKGPASGVDAGKEGPSPLRDIGDTPSLDKELKDALAPKTLTDTQWEKLKSDLKQTPKRVVSKKLLETLLGKTLSTRKTLDILKSMENLGIISKMGRLDKAALAQPTSSEVPSNAITPDQTARVLKSVASKILGPQANVELQNPKLLEHMKKVGASGMAAGRSLAVAENRSRTNTVMIAIHEVVHGLRSLGKIPPEVWKKLQDSHKELLDIIEWGIRNKLSLHPDKASLQTQLDNLALDYGRMGDSRTNELVAEAAQVIGMAEYIGASPPRTPTLPLLQRIWQSIKEFFGQPPVIDKLGDIVGELQKMVQGKYASVPEPLDSPARLDWDSLGEETPWDRENPVEKSALSVRAPASPASLSVPPPPTNTGSSVERMSFWNNWVNSLDYMKAKFQHVKPFKDFANLVEKRTKIAANIKAEIFPMLGKFEALNPQQTKTLQDFMVLADLGAEVKGFTVTQGDIKHPTGKKLGAFTLDKESAAAWTDLRKAFDIYHAHNKQSLRARMGLPVDITAKQIRAMADPTTAKGQRLLTVADLLEEDLGYRLNYLPHMRGSGGYRIEARLGDEKQVFMIASPLEIKADSLRRAQKFKAAKQTEMPQWTFSEPTLNNIESILSDVAPAQAADLVGLQLELMAAKGKFDLHGSQQDSFDRLLDKLGELKKELRTKGFAATTRQRKGIPGYIHELNEENYLRDVVAFYFLRGADHYAQAYTADERYKALGELSRNKNWSELAAYALKREKYMHEPEESYARARAITFHWALGFSLSSAALNTMQSFHTTLPFLAQMAGVGKAGGALAGALRDTVRLSRFVGNPDKLFDFERKPAWMPQGEWDFLREARRDGLLEPLMTRDQAGRRVGIATQGWERKVGEKLTKLSMLSSLAFSVAEQGNRLAAALASYRLLSDPKTQGNFKKWADAMGEDASTRYDLAKMAINTTQFDITKNNRALMLQGFGGLIGQFSTYPLHTLELMAKALRFYGGRGILTSKEGRLMFFLMNASIFTTAGALGLPFLGSALDTYEPLAKMLSQVLGVKLPDVKKSLREGAVEVSRLMGSSDPSAWANVLLKGPFRELTGLSTEKRTALNFPNPQMLTGNIMDVSPFLSILGGGLVEASQHLGRNDYFLALSSLMPLAVRNLAKAKESQTSGFRSPLTGNVSYPASQVTPSQTFAQLVGFTPSKVMDAQEQSRLLDKGWNELARDNLADEIANLYVKAHTARAQNNNATAESLISAAQKRLREQFLRDSRHKDPRDKIITNPREFNNSIKERVSRGLEGSTGPTAFKRVPKAERAVTQQDLRELYGR